MQTIKVRRRRIPPGEPGTWITLDQMERIARRASGDPAIRQLAFRILRGAGVQSNDKLGEVAALYEWVRDGLDYRKDPVGLELLTDPVITLEFGAGDCDDRSLMLASLLRSVGYPTRFLVSSNLPGPRPRFRHVFLEARVPGHGWTVLDPTRKLVPGAVYPGTTRVSRAVASGGFQDMAELVPYAQTFRVPARVIEDGTALELGVSVQEGHYIVLPEFGAVPEDDLSGFFKSLFKGVKKVVSAPVKLAAKVVKPVLSTVSSIPVVGKALPFAASLIPGVGPVAAMAMKAGGIVSAAKQLIPSGARDVITESARRAFLQPAAAVAPAPAAAPTPAAAMPIPVTAPAVTVAPAPAPAAPTAVPRTVAAVTPGAVPAGIIPGQLIQGVSNKLLVGGVLLALLLPAVLGRGRR